VRIQACNLSLGQQHKKQQSNGHLSLLTERFGESSSVGVGEFALLHLERRAASVAGSGRRQEREVLRQLHGGVGGARLPYRDLESCEGIVRVLAERRQDAARAAVGDLHGLRRGRQEVDDDGALVAAVRERVGVEGGAVALHGGLRAQHRPDHLLRLPRPAELPPRRLNVPVLLPIEHRHRRLQNHRHNRSQAHSQVRNRQFVTICHSQARNRA
jgi:hypothetical protein